MGRKEIVGRKEADESRTRIDVVAAVARGTFLYANEIRKTSIVVVEETNRGLLHQQ